LSTHRRTESAKRRRRPLARTSPVMYASRRGQRNRWRMRKVRHRPCGIAVSVYHSPDIRRVFLLYGHSDKDLIHRSEDELWLKDAT
jgi:hypothetical protein